MANAQTLPGKLLVCRVGGHLVAVRLEAVEKVVPFVELTAVPGAPPELLGVANVHGQLVPVIDMRFLLDGAAPEPLLSDQLVLIEVFGATSPSSRVALLVNEALGVHEIRDTEVWKDPRVLGRQGVVQAAGLLGREVVLLAQDEGGLMSASARSVFEEFVQSPGSSVTGG